MSAQRTYNRFFITGLPRTGTTWMMNLVNQISGVRCYGEAKFYSSAVYDVPSLLREIHDAVTPWARYIACRKHNVFRTDNVIRTIQRENIVPAETIEQAATITALAAVQGVVDHLLQAENGERAIGEKTPQMSPDELLLLVRSQPEALIVVMLRNVHDWIVSLARFYYRRRYERATEWKYYGFTDADYLHLEGFFHVEERRFLPDDTLIRLARLWWSGYVRQAEALKYRENVMVVHYEELYERPREVLEAVLSRLIEYEPAEVNLAVENSNVDHMRAQSTMVNHINGPAPNANSELLSDEDKAVIDRAVEAYHAVDR